MKGSYRLRVGKSRVFFAFDSLEGIIVTDIDNRGQAYGGTCSVGGPVHG